MASFKSWLSALRPRTLFLAIATTICGNGMALSINKLNITVCFLTTSVAIALQLLSNLANDLGDFQHGTDTSGHRVGPTRAMQSGTINLREMKKAIVLVISICAIIGCLLIYTATQFISLSYIIIFLLLGIFSIWAAIKYTAGHNPYGYKGYGDIFSFLFFGWVSVVGTFFLNVHNLAFQPWLPATGLGLFTVAVLNINNMRDMENDRNSGKITFALKLGEKKAKLYHAFLTIGGILSFLTYSIIYSNHWYQYLYLIASFLFLKILRSIYQTQDEKTLDPFLRQTSISTFIFSVLFAICINL